MAISLCGAVDLLAAIYGKDTNKLRLKYGLPLKGKFNYCLNCGKITPRKFCGAKCRHEYAYIQMECVECGVLFRRNVKQWLWQKNHNPLAKQDANVFCSRKCYGRWFGKHHGFVAHRKWDYDLVWKRHLETGFGAPKLSCLLNIPEATIGCILAKCRQKEKA